MATVNDISGGNAQLASVLAQRPAALVRTEIPAETQRPVSAAEGARSQNNTDRITISQQGRALAEGGSRNGNNGNGGGQQNNTEAVQAEQRRNEQQTGQASRGRFSSGAEQYRAVLRTVGTA
jgi:hypothetical protein